MERLKKIIIIFTGGTISMKIDERLKSVVPALSDDEIMTKVEGVDKIAETETFHYGSLPGPHISPEIMLDLSRVIKEYMDQEDVDGIVVTHGTDSLEETAYFLDVILDCKKPVIITGAMRNASELGYDGPANLSASICTAISDESIGRGVLVVFNNQVYGADEVAKTHTLSLDTFQSLDFGPLGIVDQDEVIYYRGKRFIQPILTNTIEKKVAILKTASGMDSELLDYFIKEGYKGIVLEAMGRGNVPPTMVPGIAKAIEKNIPVVIVSRCPRGRVLDSYGYEGGGKGLRDLGVILGDNLSGPKARLKLMIILGVTKEMSKIKGLFEKDLYKKI